MEEKNWKVKVFRIYLVADAGESGNLYKVEYLIEEPEVIGRFLTPADGFSPEDLPELIRKDVHEMLPQIRVLEETRERFEGKDIEV